MRYRHFSPLNRDLSVLVLGSMVIYREAVENSYALLDTWRELGGNVIDTAHIYRGGESERALGLYMQERGCREELVLIAKGAHHNQDRKRVTPEDITCDLRDSLARLRTDYADLYILHRDDPSVPVGEIVEALNAHQRAGRIRAFGGSNWTLERLEEANDYARSHGLNGFMASSPHLSLAVPQGEIWADCVDARSPEMMAWYQRTQMPLFAWSSQARGFFSGRFTPETPELDETVTRVYFHPDNWERLRRARELGEKRGGYSAIQVALAWVLAQPFPVFPLIGPATVDELRSSVKALELELTPDEVRWLDLG